MYNKHVYPLLQPPFMFFNQNRQAKKNEIASTLLDGCSGCASVFDFSIFYINMDSSEDHTGLSHISLW